MKHIAQQFELPNLPPSSRKKLPNEVARRINDILNELRFNRDTHLGNGDIRLTREKQVEILDLLGKI